MLENKHFGTDMPRGRPQKNFGLKNFGLIFGSLTYFWKSTNFKRKSFFPGDSEGGNSLPITKNNSRGILFAIISCQMVLCKWTRPF